MSLKFGWCLTGHHTRCLTRFHTQAGALRTCECDCHERATDGS